MWSGVWKMYFDLNGPSRVNINSTPPHSSERVLRVDLGVVFQQELDHGFVFVVAFCVPSLLLDLVSGYIASVPDLQFSDTKIYVLKVFQCRSIERMTYLVLVQK